MLVMCQIFGVSRSGHHDHCKRIDRAEPDAELQRISRLSRNGVGRPMVWPWLEKQGVHRDPKTVLRVMKKYDLLAEIR